MFCAWNIDCWIPDINTNCCRSAIELIQWQGLTKTKNDRGRSTPLSLVHHAWPYWPMIMTFHSHWSTVRISAVYLPPAPARPYIVFPRFYRKAPLDILPSPSSLISIFQGPVVGPDGRMSFRQASAGNWSPALCASQLIGVGIISQYKIDSLSAEPGVFTPRWPVIAPHPHVTFPVTLFITIPAGVTRYNPCRSASLDSAKFSLLHVALTIPVDRTCYSVCWSHWTGSLDWINSHCYISVFSHSMKAVKY